MSGPVGAPGRADRRRLVVNGDDFGLAPEVNRAIVRAHCHGILTSTSLMVTGPAMAEAVSIARDLPSLAVGLHLVLVQGRSACPPREIAGLVSVDRSFRERAIPAGVLYFFLPGLRAALEREVRAQLEVYRSTGLPVSHVDGHLNIHLHPVVQRVLADLAPEFGIRAVRLTREAVWPDLRWSRKHALRKAFEGTAFGILSAIAARRFRARGIVSTDRLYGMHESGGCDEPYLRHVLRSLPPGDSEIYCHPADAQNEDMRRRMPGYRPADELAALTSPAIREIVETRGIDLVSWRDLAR